MTSIQYFNENALNYLQSMGMWNQAAVDTVLFFSENGITIQSYIDLGCGPGCSSLPFLISKLGTTEIIGVDGSDTMLSLFTIEIFHKAELFSCAANVYTLRCDFETETLPEGLPMVDCIGAIALLGYLSPQAVKQLIAKSISLLKPGGYFCASSLLTDGDNCIEYLWNEVPVYLHSRKELLSFFQENNAAICLEDFEDNIGTYIVKKK